MTERRFAEITNKRIRGESRESAKQLIKAVKDFIKERNASGGSFKRAKKPGEIPAKIRKTCEETVMSNIYYRTLVAPKPDALRRNSPPPAPLPVPHGSSHSVSAC
jgi:hypothetical protein